MNQPIKKIRINSNNSISPEFHSATKPLTVEPVDSGNEIARSIERKSSLFANICFFIDDENSVTISETQEYLVLVISGYLFAIFQVNLAFSTSVFAIL